MLCIVSEKQSDAVDVILGQWARERPELDASAMGVIGRLHRVGDILDRELRTVFAAEGLGNGDFDVLATLRRAGGRGGLSPSELSAAAMVTSGAVTKRVDRLAAAGLVTRLVSRTDGRGRHIRLTRRGRTLVDRLVEEHLANEERLLAMLSARQRDQLAGILRTMLLSLEGPTAKPTR